MQPSIDTVYQFEQPAEVPAHVTQPNFSLQMEIINGAIRTFNEWQIEGFSDAEEKKVSALVEYARQMLPACPEFEEPIERMEKYIKSRIWESNVR